jgi:hypothetical protein
MKNLKKSPVVFNEEEHTYELNGKLLSGITPIVGWMFPKTYEGIPEDVLQKAADYGHDIHKRCNMLDLYGIFDDHESVKDYYQLREENGWLPVDCEYLVSDNKRVASCIDVVYTDIHGKVVLGDIKTTSQIHVENVTLQLNLYAYLFEMQNPNMHVDKLVCIWLPKPQYGKAKILECERIPNNFCEVVIEGFVNGLDGGEYRDTFLKLIGYDVVKKAETLPEKFREMEKEIATNETQMKILEARSKELKSGLLQLMQEYGKDKWVGEYITITRRAGAKRVTLDTAKVKAKYPDVYADCVKESISAESLTIKVN